MAHSIFLSSENFVQDAGSTDMSDDENQNIVNDDLNAKSAGYGAITAGVESTASAETQSGIAPLAANIVYGTEGDDYILAGTFEDDMIYGFDGNDRLYASFGNDWLDGGAGDDLLDGGPGTNIYYFEPGFGHDTIAGYMEGEDRTDIIQFGEGINQADLRLSPRYSSLAISIGEDSIVIQDYFKNESWNLEDLRFSDGSTLSLSEAWELYAWEGRFTYLQKSGNEIVDTMIIPSKWKLGDDRVITWSLPEDGALFNREYQVESTHFDEADKDAINSIFTFFESVMDVKFNYVEETEDFVGDIRLVGNKEGYGFAVFPEPGNKENAGQVWLRSDMFKHKGGNFVTMHEISHALGLDHPGTFEIVNDLGFNLFNVTGIDSILSYISSSPDNGRFKGNSYIDSETGRVEHLDAPRLGIYDIAALHYLYGANMDTNSGDTIYKFDPKVPFYNTIWDGGGIDTIDISSFAKGSILDLNEGALSSVVFYTYDHYENNGYGFFNISSDYLGYENIGIAYGAEIENAIGTQGDDTITGNPLDNHLRGGAGNDIIYGGSGNDMLDGGAGDDFMDGGEGDDVLAGGEGSDVYYVEQGFGQDIIDNYDAGTNKIDTILFGPGISRTDILAEQEGNDLVLSMVGTADRIVVRNHFLGDAYKIDQISFVDEEGPFDYSIRDEILKGGSGDDWIDGGAGNDMIFGGAGNDTLFGGAGNDLLHGGSGDDILIGGEGNDMLIGGAGDDTYYFASPGFGQDVIDNDSGGGLDRIVFGFDIKESDLRFSKEGNHLVVKFAGATDSIKVQNYFSYYANKFDGFFVEGETVTFSLDQAEIEARALGSVYGTDDADHLEGQMDRNWLYGGAGDDTLTGASASEEAGSAKNWLQGDTGNDLLIGGSGAENTYYFVRGFGQDVINNHDAGTNKTDVILFGTIRPEEIEVSRENNDLVLSVKGTTDTITVSRYFEHDDYKVDEVRFESTGTVWFREDIVISNEIHGTDGNDTLYGTVGNDIIYGYGGDDIVYGGMGNDVLYGGEGNDTLYGDNGDDFFYGGAGNDTLIGGLGNDTYYFGKAGFGQDTIRNYDATTLLRTDVILFGAAIDSADISASRVGNNLVLSLTGTTDTITIEGYFLHTANGPDQVRFEQDNTVWNIREGLPIPLTEYHGTEGDDGYFGNGSGVAMYGYGGDDSFWGGVGDDLLDGGDGQDTLIGGAGNDTLIGGAGNDTLSGNAGSDTYYYAASGFGKDVINNYDTGTNKTDVILFKTIRPEEIEVSRENNDLVLSVKGTTDTITVSRYFEHGDYKVDEVRFDSINTAWSKDYIDGLFLNFNTIHGTDRNETLRGTTADDMIYGHGGRDTLYGGAGNDMLYGGEGNDTLRGEAGNDSLYGDAGTDTLYGGAGNDMLYGGEGNDTLNGEAGDDVLDGGSGNDTLNGGAGSDTYVLRIGSGQDIINNADTGASTDTLVFEDVASSALTGLYKSGNNLVITYGDDDQVTIQNHFRTATSRIDQFKFSDGVTWGMPDLYAQYELQMTSGADSYTFTDAGLTVRGGAGNDRLTAAATGSTLYGDLGNDTLNGAAGNDILYGGVGTDTLNGGAGNDILDGGAGNDTLNGGTGSDTYVLRIGSGQDTINNADTSASTDTLVFEDVASNDLTGLYKSGNNLIIAYGDGDQVTIQNHFRTATSQIDQFKFADDVTWTMADIYAHNELHLTSGGDSYTFTDAGLTVRGGAGNDRLTAASSGSTLYGDLGNDTLTGGVGNDILIGGAGNDTFNLASGGHDTLVYELLTSGDATGGNGKDAVNGFTVGDYNTVANADRIDLGDLLNLNTQPGFTDMNDLTDYLSVTVSGRNTVIKVDLDGTGSQYQMTDLVTLNAVSTSMNQLLENNQLAIF